MIIKVTAEGCKLLDRENFRALKIVVSDHLRAGELGAAIGALGRLTSDRDALVGPVALKALAGPDVDPSWVASFDDMLNLARSGGWIDVATGAIKVHVEYVAKEQDK